MELTIEKLIYGGDGLARLPSAGDPRPPRNAQQRRVPGTPDGGKAVFVPFTIAGEVVDATITEQKPGFARARADRIIQPSPDRVQPGCPYFGDCGGCQYQHMTYEAQLRAKADILRETLQRTARIEPPEITTHASPSWNYRNRTRMHVQQTHVAPKPGATWATPGFAIGYNRFASHVLLPVRECPITSPLINRALAAVWKIGESGRMPQGVIEIEFFANAEDAEILLEVTLGREHTGRYARELAAFADALRAEVPELAGIVPFAQAATPDRIRRLNIPADLQSALGRDSLTYRTGGAQYQVSAGSFFQTNRYLVDSMVALATDGHAGDYALDIYAGVGLFTLPLSQNFREVSAVEVAPFSFHDLHANSPSNAKGYRVTTEKFLENAGRTPRLDPAVVGDLIVDGPLLGESMLANVGTLAQFDYVVLDPPRGGLGEKAASMLGQMKPPRITYVSCDPATLARDLKVLIAAGYRLTALHLLDLFPQTFHIETVVHLSL